VPHGCVTSEALGTFVTELPGVGAPQRGSRKSNPHDLLIASPAQHHDYRTTQNSSLKCEA